MKKYRYIFLCTFLVCYCCCASFAQQVIATIAGTGIAGYSGDGGPATAALFNTNVVYATTDAAGNVYLTDQDNHCIRKINPAGIITTIAGVGTPGYSGDGGPASSAKLKYPYGIAIDPAGNIYIADGLNYAIRKINPAGIISTIVGTGTSGFSGDGGPATAAKTNLVTGIKCDALGNVYIADHGNHRVRKINSAGIIKTYAGNGAATYSGDGGPATAAALWQPHDIALDAAGNLYIADANNHRIRKVNTSGIITTIAGTGTAGYSGDGGPAIAANLSYYYGIAVDPAGNILINDAYNGRIRMINTAGIINTIAGTGTWGYEGDGCSPIYAQISGWSVHVDAAGNIYLPDNRTRKIYTGVAPSFINGTTQTAHVCKNSTNDLSPLFAVADPDVLQPETWAITIPPVHGTLLASYSTTSTGGVIIPSGVIYTPTPGYVGNDSFRITVSDCIGVAGYTTMRISVDDNPVIGDVTAPAKVCPGLTATYTSSVTGGVWSSSNTSIATIGSSGVVSGVMPGTCIISYTVSNACGTVTDTFPLTVLPFRGCTTGTSITVNKKEGLMVYPNPATGTHFNAYISSGFDEEAIITIVDLLGNKVAEQTTRTNTSVNINTGFPPGIYLVTATTAHNSFSARLQH